MVTSVWHQVLILVQQVENVTNDHDNAERTKTAQIGTSAQSLMESQKALDRLERRHTRVWQRVAHVGFDKKKIVSKCKFSCIVVLISKLTII